jgi:protein-L-isoaspartate(D-aspartate) O-methyltransferase
MSAGAWDISSLRPGTNQWPFVQKSPVNARESMALSLCRLQRWNVMVSHGDGAIRWPEQAPFDAIHVAAAAPEPPPAVLDQLAPGGRLVIPLGRPHGDQDLWLLTRTDAGMQHVNLGAVRFVPFVAGVDG